MKGEIHAEHAFFKDLRVRQCASLRYRGRCPNQVDLGQNRVYRIAIPQRRAQGGAIGTGALGDNLSPEHAEYLQTNCVTLGLEIFPGVTF
jgi:hypothetical protein